MKRFILFLAAAVMVSTVLAGFKYEGEWGSLGSGPGQFKELYGVDVAPDGNVYVADSGNQRIQFFSPTGSYVSEWDSPHRDGKFDVAVAPNGNVYTGGCDGHNGYVCFTKSGMLLRSWGCKASQMPIGHGDIAGNGNVYAAEDDFPVYCEDSPFVVAYYTPNGSLIGSWSVHWEPVSPGIGVAPDYTVYVGLNAIYMTGILRYTSNGSLLGSWGSEGTGNGQLRGTPDVDVAPDGRVFVADSGNNRVQYFTPSGSFLGKWGTRGTGPGEFNTPVAIAVSRDGKRVYVADSGNSRIQYFVDDTAIMPTSLGKVKALFK